MTELRQYILIMKTQQPHELSNLRFASEYFDSLPSDDISRRYAAGEKYVASWYTRVKFLFSIDSHLSELTRFYPYQPAVKKTYEMYQEKMSNNKRNALILSGFSIVAVHQLAKNNIILPFFNKFCMLKTHRLFRQYLTLAFLPYLLTVGYTNYFFLNQTDRLWRIHANRLNNGHLEDPQDSQYPIDLLGSSQAYSYVTPWVHKYDRQKKWDNEVDIMLAPDYEPVEEWEKKPLFEVEDEDEEGEDGEGDDDEE